MARRFLPPSARCATARMEKAARSALAWSEASPTPKHSPRLSPSGSVGGYWPYATSVYDFIHRAMPRDQSGTLTPNEVYALTAFILFKSNIIKEGDVLDQKTLPKVQMPNRNGFVPARILRTFRTNTSAAARRAFAREQ